jgi:predicted transcriptional regulator
MRFIYELHDLRIGKNCIAIVHLIDGLLSPKEHLILSQELEEMPRQKDEIHLDQRKIDILKYIADKNAMHSVVYYKHISSDFKLSRITARLWINELQQKGLLNIKKFGRVKQIFISDKGMDTIADVQ